MGRYLEDFTEGELKRHMKMHQVTFEERDQVIRPLAETGQEAYCRPGCLYL